MWKKLMATSALAAVLAAPAYGADTTSSMRDTMLNQAETQTERQGMENRMAASEWIGRDIYAGDVNGTRLGSVENVRMTGDNQPEYVILTPDAALDLDGEAYAVPYDRFEEASLQGTNVLVADIAAEDLRGAPRQAQVQGSNSVSMTDSIADDDTTDTDTSAQASADTNTQGGTQTGTSTSTQATSTQSGSGSTAQTSAAPETQAANQAADSQTSASATADTSTSSGTQTSASGSTGTDTDLTTSSVGNISAMTRVDLASVAQSDLNAAVVLSEEGEEIARVDNVLTNDAGNPDAVVINAGTYLGGDDKQVAISTDNAELRRNESGEIYMVTSLSRADLQGAPDYTAEAYESDAESVTVDPSM